MQNKEKNRKTIFNSMNDFFLLLLFLIYVCAYIYKEDVIVSLSLRPLFASTCKYRSYIIYLHVVSVDR